MSFKWICLIAALFLPAPAAAQSNWDYTATLYGWFPGLSSTVETPFGDLETEVDFDEILESLDLGFFGAFEARKGRWSFIADAMYADLSSDVDTPFGTLFSDGEVEAQTALVGAYATYALVDESNLRFEIGGGLRYVHATVDTLLLGQEMTPNASFSVDGGWADLLLAARVNYSFDDHWYGAAYADIGGFGIGESSDLTWQGLAGIGYRFNEKWSTVGGYRYLSIEREFGTTDVTTELSGPFLGV